MSCGNPHEVPCSEVLDRVYSYLDGEMDRCVLRPGQRSTGTNAGPWPPTSSALEEAVKRLVHKHCGL